MISRNQRRRAEGNRRQTETPKALGAYIFAGGHTVGVAKHFDVLAHFEESSYGVATARHNFPKLPIFVGPSSWPVDDPQYKNLPWVYGNPPCAAWSVAGYTKTRGTDKWRTDPRVECTVKHFGLLKTLRPKVWSWESVTQAWTKGREFVNALAKEAMESGYSVTVLLHDAQWLGLPQTRKRFFMICHRVEFSPLAPNWSPPPTALEALAGVVPGEPRHEGSAFLKRWPAKTLRKIKPGERLVRYWEREVAGPKPWPLNSRGEIAGRPSFGLYRLPVDGVGGAIVGYSIVHPKEPRWLSTEEMQVLNGFPERFHFTPKGAGARASEIARGVCPPVAEWLARSVAAAVAADRPISKPTYLEVDYRRPPTDGFSHWREVSADEVPAGPTPKAPRGPSQPRLPRTEVAQGEEAPPRPHAFPAADMAAGSVAHIRAMLRAERWTTEEILESVKYNWIDSKATAADVSYHRGKMKAAGSPVRTVKVTSQGRRLLPLRT